MKLTIPEALVERSSGGLLSNLLLKVALSTAQCKCNPRFVLPKLGSPKHDESTPLWDGSRAPQPSKARQFSHSPICPPKVQVSLQLVLLILVLPGTAEKGLALTALQVAVGCC